MINHTDYKTPGQLIAALLEMKGWSKKTLAIVLSVDESVITRIMKGERKVDADFALLLEEVLGQPADDFLKLQHSFDLGSARLKAIPDKDRANRAHLFGGLPISDMITRGWIQVGNKKDAKEVEVAVAKFFGAATTAEIEIMPHAAKKTQTTIDVSPVQLAWLYRVKTLATGLLAPKYTDAKGRDAIKLLKPLLSAVEETRHVPRILTEAGIRFLLVEGLQGSKIDGVCFWLNEHSPVIALSMRLDRIDNFWFVLRHELEHVLCRHGQQEIIVDVDVGTEESAHSEEERLANAAAADFCVSKKMMDAFIARKAPLFATRDMLALSKIAGVHPGVVVGQIHWRANRYELFRNYLVKVRAHIAPSAIVDGWGDIAPIVS